MLDHLPDWLERPLARVLCPLSVFLCLLIYRRWRPLCAHFEIIAHPARFWLGRRHTLRSLEAWAKRP